MPKGTGPKRQPKACPSCAQTAALYDEVARLNDKIAQDALERGPKCQHSVEGADARNVRLMQDHAAVIARLNKTIAEQAHRIADTERGAARGRKAKHVVPRQQAQQARTANQGW